MVGVVHVTLECTRNIHHKDALALYHRGSHPCLSNQGCVVQLWDPFYSC